MFDREKIVIGLKCMIDGNVPCKECGYSKSGHGTYDCKMRCASDTLALLKEQEPAKAIKDGDDTWKCESCGTVVGWDEFGAGGIENVQYKFCPECGRQVKWDELSKPD